MTIASFTDENFFLSNFHLCDVEMDGITYPSVEHAYQAAKTLDLDLRLEIVGLSTGAAKKWGRKQKLRPDWENVKLAVMEQLLRKKFSIPSFRDKLIATGDQDLIEGNWWGDSYWGVHNGVGENHLGKILMKLRSEIIAGNL